MNYKVSEEEYITVLEQQLKQKRKRPVPLFLFLFSTAGQTLFVIYLLLSSTPSAAGIAGLLVLSVSLTGLSLLNFFSTRPRAKKYLSMLRSKGRISEEFWKLHTLKLEDETISIQFGSYSNSCEITQIRVTDNKTNAYLLSLGKSQSVFDIVPYSAFGSEPQRAGFAERLRQAAIQVSLRGSEAVRDSIPPDARVLAEFSYDEDSYLKDQQSAFRRMFTTKLAWTPLTILLLAASCFLLAYAISSGRVLSILTAVAAAVLLNFHYIRIFSPLIGRRIRRDARELRPYFPDGKIKIYLDKAKGQMVAVGSVYCISFPLSDMKAVRRIPGGAAIYLNQNLILTISSMENISEIQSLVQNAKG
ncbi:hypothetical protein [Caproicibacter sp.]